MSEELLVRHCSPTLAGLKTGSLFVCACPGPEEMRAELRRWNSVLAGKGLRVLSLRRREQKHLIYVYRISDLRRDLQAADAKALLYRLGYTCESPGRCIAQLIRRINTAAAFPHEIGLFLGYPPWDVLGFIQHKAQDCLCSGCWKVYADAQHAQELFAKYKKCTEIYCAQFAHGVTIERLTVAG